MNLKLPWKKEQNTYPIVRVDDRLIHGQVVVGWALPLNIDPLILSSDRVVRDPALSRTIADIIPSEMNGEILSLTETAERWRRGDFKAKRAMIVVEAPVDALKLVRLGAPIRQITLGGLHFREERTEILPYVFLSDWDRTTLSEIRREGVRIQCQDVPSATPVTYEE